MQQPLRSGIQRGSIREDKSSFLVVDRDRSIPKDVSRRVTFSIGSGIPMGYPNLCREECDRHCRYKEH